MELPRSEPVPSKVTQIVVWGGRVFMSCLIGTTDMSLTLVGLGLGDERDITVKGLDAIKSADAVFLEAYTSILPGVDTEKLERFYGRAVLLADRLTVEQRAEEMLERCARGQNVVMLVVGDPFCATTHVDLILRAKKAGVPTAAVHNASIISAVGCTGLQVYRFGEVTSIPFFEPKWRPDSFYAKLRRNKEADLHTLCLLDIKVKEQTEEDLMRGRPIFQPPRFMTIGQAAEQLMEVERNHGFNVCGAEAMAVGLARLDELALTDFGPPLHSLVICASLHDIEREGLADAMLHPAV
eukprot:Polyplicarium_translucidae@DN3296_c0_g1_i3.p1